MKINIVFGHIIIPSGVDPTKYKLNCYSRERVSVVLENGQGIILDCYIDKTALREIYFPKDEKSLGSYVAILQQRGKKGVIIGVVSYENESQLLTEGDIRLEKVDINGNVSSIRGNSTDGNMSLNVSNKQKEAVININVTGKDNSGKLNITTNNELKIRTTNKVDIESFGVVSVKALDKDNKDKFTEVKVENGKISFGKGSEPVLLGDETQKQLDKMSKRIDGIIDAINNAVPTPGDMSGAGLQTTMKAGLLLIIQKEDFKDIKSELTFTE